MYADLIRTHAPLAWWPMDEASGALADRGSVGSYAATAFGSGITYRQAGLPFKGVRLTGAGGFQFTPTAALLGSAYTVEAWAYFDQGFVNADIYQILSVSGSSDWRRFLRVGQGTTTDAFMDAAQASAGVGTAFASAAGSLQTGKAYHLAVTYSGGVGTPYINGVAGTPSTTSNSTPTNVTSQNGWLLGGWAGDNTLWRSKGVFAHIASYGSALSAAQIAEHYRVGAREGVSY